MPPLYIGADGREMLKILGGLSFLRCAEKSRKFEVVLVYFASFVNVFFRC